MAASVPDVVVPPYLCRAVWNEGDWANDLLERGSIPDITAPFVDGRSWDDLHFWLKMAGVRRELSFDGVVVPMPETATEVFAQRTEASPLLKVWVGPVQFNAHYLDQREADFDVPIEALADADSFDCLVAFMDFLANVAGDRSVLTHEGNHVELVIRSASATETDSDTSLLGVDAVRLANLRRPRFVSYRGVIAPADRLDRENVDRWLEAHDVVATTYAVSHTHLYDELRSIDDDAVYTALGDDVAAHWRAQLLEQMPDVDATIGVAGNPEEYGPTVWVQLASDGPDSSDPIS